MILAKKAKLSFNNNDDFLEKLAEKSDSVFSEAEKLFSNSQNGPTTEEKFETDFSKLFDKIIPILKNFKNDSLVLAKVINLLSKGFNRCLKLYRNDSKKKTKIIEKIVKLLNEFTNFGKIDEPNQLLLFNTCLAISFETTAKKHRQNLAKILLKIFIANKSQRTFLISKIASSITNKKHLFDFCFSNGRQNIKSTFPTALFLYLIQSTSVAKIDKKDRKNATTTEMSKRYEKTTDLLENALSELFGFVMLPQKDFSRNFQKDVFSDFVESLLNMLFLPEFPAAEIVLFYLISFIATLVNVDDKKELSNYDKRSSAHRNKIERFQID